MNEFERELQYLQDNGIKNSKLRLEYEEKVRALSVLKEKLQKKDMTVNDIAKKLHRQRRELGKQYKEAAPPLFREYIYFGM